MSYDQELSVAAHLDHLVRESADVDLVKRRIDFVEYAERGRPILEDCKHKRDRCHRFLAARQQQHVLQSLARRLCDQVDARLEHVVFVDQDHLAAAAAKPADALAGTDILAGGVHEEAAKLVGG